MQLYPFQQASVARALSLANPVCYWELSETGLGKSPVALEVARRCGARRILVVTLASVKHGWSERCLEWMPDYSFARISAGLNRKYASKPEQWRQQMLRTADICIVSYELIDEIPQEGWEAIIVDEMHTMVSYRSKTVKQLQELFAANPAAHKIGISATPMSAEPKNTWTLLKLFWPSKWGEATKTGEPPYWFLNTYCNRIETLHGGFYRGLNEENAEKFARAIATVSSRTLRADVAHLLPPLDLQPLVIEAGTKKPWTHHVVEWADTASKESSHIGLFTHYRKSAEIIASELGRLPRYRNHEIIVLHGEMQAEGRAKALARIRQAPRAVVCATMHALGTGISLTFVKQYLVAELVATPSDLVQLLGRFSRLDEDGKVGSHGKVLLFEGKDDDKTRQLARRLKDENTLIRNGQGEKELLSALDRSKNNAQSWDRWVDNLVETFRDYSGDFDEDDGL